MNNNKIELEKVKDKIESDRGFRRSAYWKYWGRYLWFVIVCLIALFFTMLPYAYLSSQFNHVLLIALPPLALVVSLYVSFRIVDPSKCMACGNKNVIHSPPIYCRTCGMTYLFHRLGRWSYNKRA